MKEKDFDVQAEMRIRVRPGGSFSIGGGRHATSGDVVTAGPGCDLTIAQARQIVALGWAEEIDETPSKPAAADHPEAGSETIVNRGPAVTSRDPMKPPAPETARNRPRAGGRSRT